MPPMELPSSAAVLRRNAIWAILLFAVALSCVFLYRAADSMPFRLPRDPHVFPTLTDGDSFPSEDRSLERVLKDAAMPDKSVILTTLNEAWAGPNSILDLFLESFRIGERTRRLLNHLVIVALDRKAFFRCRAVHSHCFALVTPGADFSREAYFMTPDYLNMMWRRIDFLRSVLEMGYSFVFTDADVMWFRDPFPEFHPGADFQIACDHFSGSADDLVNNVPNGGFKFVRSNGRSVEFYKFWYASHSTYPGLHDQDVLKRIKNDSFVRDIGLKMRFLDTALFGGFCEPSRELDRVCTMHANCCFGMDNKLHDLRILIEDWKRYLSLPPRLKPFESSWRVPQNCSLDSLRTDVHNADEDEDETRVLYP
ncbi:Nucleotide-diphospho-sugar transferase family protein [Striga hermonthica]|uniref:Nucleotide-diphospho-sugar transferase family protein n=1 Tax=Striga hermonthica TaxID=68872 RepID=A0A9N7RA91_STRHE|nr:Nucleotide-diphospho-sugar transferase family protein [Striga hermonthica]